MHYITKREIRHISLALITSAHPAAMLSTTRLPIRLATSSRPMAARKVPMIAGTQKRFLFEGWGVPQPPGNIVGTVNDPVKTPPPSPVHGSYHWTFERIITLGLVPLAVLPLATGELTPVFDAVLGGLIVVHSNMGMESVITDYFPKRKFPKGHGVLKGLLYTGSVATLYGVYKLETEGDGIVGSVKKIWTA